jgi:AcrR family transcriptional regulator
MAEVRIDPRVERRSRKKAAIVEAAWRIARAEGFGGLSLHALARSVGLRQPSLYAYFDSKNALIDEMFADANRQLLGRVERLGPSPEPRRAVHDVMRELVAFCMEDGARAELMFQRPVPGFEPSAESYAAAQRFLERAVELLGDAGISDPEDVDVFVGVIAGVINAQLSNDPGGDRWTRHLDRVIDMVFEDCRRRPR